MALASANGQIFGRTSPYDQSGGKRMDELLRQLLQVSLIPHLSTPEPYSVQMGYPEIQKIEGA